MFGKNPHRQILISGGEFLQVHKIFPTIQGEGPLSGMPAGFIRLAGCNLACVWCDTDFESSYEGTGNEMSVDDIVGEIMRVIPTTPGHIVVLTGGEPMRQNILPLVDRLVWQGRHVQIETAGTIPPQFGDGLADHVLKGDLTVVVSPKTPKVHAWYQNFAYHWKYIIGADDSLPDDGLPWRNTQRREQNYDLNCNIARPSRVGEQPQIWVSPRDDQDERLNALNQIGRAHV